MEEALRAAVSEAAPALGGAGELVGGRAGEIVRYERFHAGIRSGRRRFAVLAHNGISVHAGDDVLVSGARDLAKDLDTCPQSSNPITTGMERSQFQSFVSQSGEV